MDPYNIRYLDTKRRRMGHLLDGLETLAAWQRGRMADAGTRRGARTGTGLRGCVVVARWNGFVTRKLSEGAVSALRENGLREADIDGRLGSRRVRSPNGGEVGGERSGRFDAVICLAAVIRGETAHFEYVAGGAAEGIAAVARERACQSIFGVLTVDSVEQALARGGGKEGHKGEEAARAAIEMAKLCASRLPD